MGSSKLGTQQGKFLKLTHPIIHKGLKAKTLKSVALMGVVIYKLGSLLPVLGNMAFVFSFWSKNVYIDHPTFFLHFRTLLSKSIE